MLDRLDKPAWIVIALLSFNVGFLAATAAYAVHWLDFERDINTELLERLATVEATLKDRERVVEKVYVLESEMRAVKKIVPLQFEHLQRRRD